MWIIITIIRRTVVKLTQYHYTQLLQMFHDKPKMMYLYFFKLNVC